MSSALILSNLLAYAFQVALLAVAAALLPRLLRIRLPGFLLAYWQIVLLACLALPLLQTWHRLEAPAANPAWAVQSASLPDQSFLGNLVPTAAHELPWQGWIVAALLLGAGLRLGWMALGLCRLRLLRVRADRLDAIPEPARLYCLQFGLQPVFYRSSEIDAPATFGLWRTHVILPGKFPDLDACQQRAVLCHELLHLKRRDWLFVLAEETVKSLFWFHPAVWWLTARIRLAREQCVDREAVRRTGQRKAYLDLLLATAESRLEGQTALAPSFLRPGHLSERVASLIEEVSMSRFRLIQSAIVVAGLLLLAGRAALWAFPLQLPAEALGEQQPAPPRGEPLKLGGSVMASRLIDRVEPEYPDQAKEARLQGVVFLKITVNEQGEVWKADVVRGHPLLTQAALDAVGQWVYSPVLLNGKPVPVQATVTVHFRLQGSEGGPGSEVDAPVLPRIRLSIDRDGNVWQGDRQMNDDDLDQLAQQEVRLFVMQHPDAPGDVVREVVQRMNEVAVIIGPRKQTTSTLLVESSRQALEKRLAGRRDTAVFAAYLDGRGNVEGLECLSGPDKPALQRLAAAQLTAYLIEQSKLDRPALSLNATEIFVALIQRP